MMCVLSYRVNVAERFECYTIETEIGRLIPENCIVIVPSFSLLKISKKKLTKWYWTQDFSFFSFFFFSFEVFVFVYIVKKCIYFSCEYSKKIPKNSSNVFFLHYQINKFYTFLLLQTLYWIFIYVRGVCNVYIWGTPKKMKLRNSYQFFGLNEIIDF